MPAFSFTLKARRNNVHKTSRSQLLSFGNVTFSNIKVYNTSDKTINFSSQELSSYTGTGGGQDGSSTVTVVNNDSIHLQGNFWKKLSQSYNVTKKTVLEFDLTSSDTGEVLAIGLDNDQLYDYKQFRLGGTQADNKLTSSGIPWYTAGTGAVHYTIPVGQYYTGNMSYLVFIGDDDANSSTNASFSNVRIYESHIPTIDLSNYAVTSYQGTSSGQDVSGGATILDNGASIQLTGNTWKKISLPYEVDAYTVLEFDLTASDTGELLAIGLDNDQGYDFKQYLLGGSDGNSNLSDPGTAPYISGSGTRHYKLHVGRYYRGSVAFLVFIMDDDADASGNAIFSNVSLHGH